MKTLEQTILDLIRTLKENINSIKRGPLPATDKRRIVHNNIIRICILEDVLDTYKNLNLKP